MPSLYAADLELALAIADAVDALTLPASQGDIQIELKPDDTPVTATDRAAEMLVRERIGVERPGDAFQGEEYGATVGSSRRWIVDPIDGTKNFVRGVPAWATLISLYDGDVPAVGVVSAPALGRRWFAAKGGGAWSVTTVHGFPTAPRQMSVSSVSVLSQASLSYSSLGGWEERGLLEDFLGLTREVRRTRAFGDFWSYIMVAEGAVDIACEPELALHDMGALVPIVLEAGGRFTSLAGHEGPWGPDALASNGLLHQVTLDRLRVTDAESR
jgi:histidinol-phosphatase